ncbi:hypothetical protein EX30DRAFT_160736 [Ascodesmis nigricans]|uniref:Uncharacterized protein n=1 Tax=Ascodesmis nigricans TaxID=341454 RepID=A0A4S2MMU2_9PEZI|nr:hypothetical protein EX30DRAFT_160736 [Ascodesmis nigricans]
MSDVTMAWAVESLFWAVVEERWLQAWFPVGLDAEEKKSLEATEERLELCAGHANAESWRACTCDLLSRCSVGTIVAETNKVFSDLDGAFNLVTGSRISRYYRSSFRRILEVTLKLAMDMKCCIPFYEVDKTVEVSDQFDDDKMEAVEDENPASKVVVGIVSRGIVERRFKGDIDIVAWVRKNRVLLRDVEGDS